MNISERPTYLVAGGATLVGGVLYPHGATVVFDGWPKGSSLEALNEPARRIQRYYFDRGAWPFFPVSPTRSGHGIFLPFELPHVSLPSKRDPRDPDGSELFSPPDEVTSLMPMYRTRLTHVGHRELKGRAFSYLAWPDPRFEPANNAARAVTLYLEEHRDHPERLSSPWCLFRQSTYLPALRPLGRMAYAPSPSPPVASHRSGFSNSAHTAARKEITGHA